MSTIGACGGLQHFVDGEPTEENPDPIPATGDEAVRKKDPPLWNENFEQPKKRQRNKQGGNDGSIFLQAAEKLGREDILRDLQYKTDLLAVEAKYHKSCYRNFLASAERCRHKSGSSVSSAASSDTESRCFQESFEHLCKEVVEPRLKCGGEVMTVRYLKRRFQKIAAQMENGTFNSTYKTGYMKARLKAAFPHIQFAHQQNPSAPQVAFFPSSRSLNASMVIDPASIINSSDSDDDSGGYSDENETTEVSDDDSVGYSDENETTEVPRTMEYSFDLRNLFMASLTVRNAVKEAPTFQPSTWPPPAEEMTEENIQKLVPAVLFNMLAWVCGISGEPQINQVLVESGVRRHLLSIAQDIIFLANPSKTPPKHLMLGVAVKHITGSKRLTDILNGLGHSASYSTVQRLETDMAEFQLLQPVPTTLRKESFTTLVWDNIDFLEETPSGSNTTHCVNGIAIQTPTQQNETDIIVPPSVRRKRRRTLDLEPNVVCVPKAKHRRIDPDIPDTGSDVDVR